MPQPAWAALDSLQPCEVALGFQHASRGSISASCRPASVGTGAIEFKRDGRTGEFLTIEPTVGRIDSQEEVATLHGTNIPLAGYLHEIGAPELRVGDDPPPVIWRDFFSHCMSVRNDPAKSNTRVYDAYWRRDDSLPSLFHLLDGSAKFLRRALHRGMEKEVLTRNWRATRSREPSHQVASLTRDHQKSALPCIRNPGRITLVSVAAVRLM
jgi:hypothetical protein